MDDAAIFLGILVFFVGMFLVIILPLECGRDYNISDIVEQNMGGNKIELQALGDTYNMNGSFSGGLFFSSGSMSGGTHYLFAIQLPDDSIKLLTAPLDETKIVLTSEDKAYFEFLYTDYKTFKDTYKLNTQELLEKIAPEYVFYIPEDKFNQFINIMNMEQI